MLLSVIAFLTISGPVFLLSACMGVLRVKFVELRGIFWLGIRLN